MEPTKQSTTSISIRFKCFRTHFNWMCFSSHIQLETVSMQEKMNINPFEWNYNLLIFNLGSMSLSHQLSMQMLEQSQKTPPLTKIYPMMKISAKINKWRKSKNVKKSDSVIERYFFTTSFVSTHITLWLTWKYCTQFICFGFLFLLIFFPTFFLKYFTHDFCFIPPFFSTMEPKKIYPITIIHRPM